MTPATPETAELLSLKSRLDNANPQYYGGSTRIAILPEDHGTLVALVGAAIAAKTADEPPAFQPANVRAWMIATPFAQCEEWARYVDHMLKALSTTGEPKR